MIAKKPFEVEVHFEKQGEGVLVAQGGDTHGWVLFVKDNIAHFSLSLGGKIETVKAKEKLAEKDGKILATLNSKGIVELSSGKRKLGSGKVSSLVKEMPIDGLQVGRDEGGTVGDYKDAFDFNGKIKKVRIKIN
jgi:arylsulfatase